MKNKLITANKLFLFLIFILPVTFWLFCFCFQATAFEIENRTAASFKIPTLKTVLKGNFQDNLEKALADQFPFAEKIRFQFNQFNNYRYSIFAPKENEQETAVNYIRISEDWYIAGDHIVYKVQHGELSDYDEAIKYINSFPPNIKTYVYFVPSAASQTGNTLDFNQTNWTSDIDYLKEKLPRANVSWLPVISYEDYDKWYFKTDHHWNNIGAYKGYKDIIRMIGDEDNILKPIKQVKLTDNFQGASARLSTYTKLYDDFSVYKFNFPKHKTYVDDIEVTHDRQQDWFSGKIKDRPFLNYHAFYDVKTGTLYDYNQNEKENILILGNSYVNDVAKLISSHFNETYVLKTNDNIEDIDLVKFMQERNITNFLIVGNKTPYIDPALARSSNAIQ